MKELEEFMRDFFRAKIADEEKHQKIREPFRQKFFRKDCLYDSHADTLRRLKSEKILSIDEMDLSGKVVTEQVLRHSGGEQSIRLRYQLVRSNNDWFISDVETACLLCGGRGDNSCPGCKGEHWLRKNISP